MNKLLYVICLLALLAFLSCSRKSEERGAGFDRGAAGGFPVPLLSGPGPMGGPAFHSPSQEDMVKLKEEVGFDKPTEEKILVIIRSFNTFMKSSVIKVQKEELNIREELLKDKPDLDYVQKCIQNKTRVFGEIEFNQIKRDLDIKSLLTVEQFEKWMSLGMRHHPGRFRGMRDNGMRMERPDQMMSQGQGGAATPPEGGMPPTQSGMDHPAPMDR